MADPTRTSPSGGEPDDRDSGGVSWRRWVLGIALVLLAVIAVQNSQSVEFRILFVVETEMPLIVGLLLAGALGAVIGYVAPLVLQHRRQGRERGAER